jgi:RND family efflux transporter MFP subunit
MSATVQSPAPSLSATEARFPGIGDQPPRGSTRRRKGARWLGVLSLCLVTALLVAWATGHLPLTTQTVAPHLQLHTVRRGTLEIKVVEQGNLESAGNVDVRCEVEGRGGGGSGGGSGTQIIWLFPEGEFARKGEKIVELDPTALKQAEIEQQIAQESARELLITAKNNHEAARIAVDEYLRGTFPQELGAVDAEITVAKEELRRAEEYARYSKELYRKGYLNKLSMEADQFAIENQRLLLQAAETKRTALLEYTKKKTESQLASARDSAHAAMKSAEARFALEENKLKLIREQLEKCTIHAPKDGMVIYGNPRDMRWGEGTEIKEGAIVRLRQVIVQLPDLTQMRVKAKVHESMIERVRRDQRVDISIDALPQLSLHGTVASINNQPEPASRYSSNIKEYGVWIDIDEQVENLKPGMTAEVEILVNRLNGVLTIPVQCVTQRGEKAFCYVAGEADVERRPVVLGASNDVLIEIKDGVSEGDRVILNPRSAVPEARDEELTSPPHGADAAVRPTKSQGAPKDSSQRKKEPRQKPKSP